MSQIKKDCQPKACDAEIVEVVLCGPQICVQNKDCESTAAPEAPVAP